MGIIQQVQSELRFSSPNTQCLVEKSVEDLNIQTFFVLSSLRATLSAKTGAATKNRDSFQGRAIESSWDYTILKILDSKDVIPSCRLSCKKTALPCTK